MMRGFVEGFAKVVPETGKTVYNSLKEILEQASSSRAFLTGHSLGGASAVVFAMLLAYRHASSHIWQTQS